MSTLQVDLDLIRKYNVPGPRYTSYPPATQFTENFSVDELETLIGRNNEIARDLSLYFHLPFCRSLCWYCGCTTVITTDQRQSRKYLEYLERELILMQPRLNRRRRVTQIHLGGGTPTFFQPDEIRQLGSIIRARFNVAPEVEAGVEIDPRQVTPEHLAALRESGFNRASIGLQDNALNVQKAVHRIQPFALTKQVVEWSRAAGFRSINLDLIYGLPHQTPESFSRTLKEALSLNPDRLAVFNYAHVPWMKPAQKLIKPDTLPTPETKLELLKLTIEELTAAGYIYVGMDHFARADDELARAQKEKRLQRNFQGYSTCAGADIYAFGMSAISQAEGFFWQNMKGLPAYYAAIDAAKLPIAKAYFMSEDDRIRQQVIMRLMCDLSLDYDAMSASLGVDFREYFSAELNSLDEMEADGLLVKLPDGLLVTDVGRLLIRNIAMRFDACTRAQKESRFSHTI